ncbi:MAG: amidohydrolase family protein [Thermoleophilaceae bacterium]
MTPGRPSATGDASPVADESGLPARAPALLVRGGFVYTVDDEERIHPSGSVLVVGDRIAAVGDDASVRRAVGELEPALREGLQTLDAQGMMVLPGFVNPHWHENFSMRLVAPNGALRPTHDHGDRPGLFARGGDVAELSREFDRRYAIADSLLPDEAEAIARYSLWTQLRSGTTTFGDVGSVNRPEALVAATRALGLRGAISLWASDAECVPGEGRHRRTRDADAVLARVEALLQSCADDRSGRVRAMPSVIYPPNMTDALGVGLAELVGRYDTPFATHIAALRNEAEIMEACFGASSIRRFSELGLLTERLLAVHCAFADDAERALLLDAGVHINHSPAKYGTAGERTLSDSKLIVELLRAGLDVSLSTDGETLPLGGMAEAMRQAWQAHNEIWADNTAVRPTTALAMATRVAARGLRWDAEVGSLEVGKQADLVLVPVDDWRYLLRARPLEGFLMLGGSADVRTVIVAGRVLLQDGRATFVDERDLERRYVEALTSFSRRAFGIADDVLERIAAA